MIDGTLKNSASSLTEIEKVIDAKLHEFYNIKYLNAPLLLNNVDNYTQEAKAAIRIYEGLSTGHVLIGLTKMLRSYRLQINNISVTLSSTNAVECAKADTVVSVNHTSASTGYAVTKVKLADSARLIADIYSTNYFDCSNGTAYKLKTRMTALDELVTSFKTDFIDKGEQVILGCTTAASVEEAVQCVQVFIDDLRTLLQQFLRTVDTEGTENHDVTEVFSLGTFDEDLYSVPMCLFYAMVNAAQSANAILRQIQICAANVGVPVNINEITNPENVVNLPTILNFIQRYYNKTRQTSLSEGDLSIFINFLFYEIDKAHSILSKNYSTESFLAEDVKLRNALRLAAESTNITLKTCVNEAYKYVKADAAAQVIGSTKCAEDSLNYTINLQASLNASYSQLLTDTKRSDHISQIPECIAKNFLNAAALDQCISDIYYKLEVTLDAAGEAYARGMLDLAEYMRKNQTTAACKMSETSLYRIYQCNNTMFSFIVDLDTSFIR